MTKKLKFFEYEDIPFKGKGEKISRCWFLENQLSVKRFWLDIASDARRALVSVVRKIWSVILPLLKKLSKRAGNGWKRYRNRQPKFFEISLSFGKAVVKLKLSWIAVLFLSFSAYNFWPSKHIIAEPTPVKEVVAEVKPIETKLEPVEPVVKRVEPKPTGEANCGDNYYMAQIYTRESGCRTWAYNAGGCKGLGQACPGSKLPCGDYDWACQDSWFRNYAIQRYGSYANAWAVWQSQHWW